MILFTFVFRYDSIFPTVVKCPPETGSYELGIVRQFTFSSNLQRMSVIVRRLDVAVHEAEIGGKPMVFL